MSDIFNRAWSVNDWANYLQRKPRTIWRYVDDPKYAYLEFPQPEIREGNNVRWMPETVRAWVELIRKRAASQSEDTNQVA